MYASYILRIIKHIIKMLLSLYHKIVLSKQNIISTAVNFFRKVKALRKMNVIKSVEADQKSANIPAC